MKLTQLRYLCAACRHGNLSRAAEELFVSQPSVSSAIKDLEAEFGITIFHRLSKGFTLTREGKILHEYAEKLLEQADHMVQIMSDLGHNRNYIRLGVPPMIGAFIFPRLYKGFIQQNAGVQILTQEYGGKDLLQSLENDLLDAIIIPNGGAVNNDCHILKIAETETVFCVHASHPLASKKWISAAEIGGEPLIMFQPGFYHNELICRMFSEQALSINIIHYSGQLHTIMEFISSGICSGFLFREIIQSAPDIVGIPLEHPLCIDINLMWKRNQYMYQDLLRFISYAKEASIT